MYVDFLSIFLSFYYNYGLFSSFFFILFAVLHQYVYTISIDRAQIIDNISESGVLVVDVNGFIIICEVNL